MVLPGDVRYSEAALAEVMDERRPGWNAFGRADASRYIRKPHGEVFGLTFWSPDRHARMLDILDAFYREGACRRPAAGWAHHRLMIGEDPGGHGVGASFVEIDDFTDDFDAPGDVETWNQARERWLGHFSQERIAQIPDAVRAGAPIAEVRRDCRVSEATVRGWQRQYPDFEDILVRS